MELTTELEEKLKSLCLLESTIKEDHIYYTLKFEQVKISTCYLMSDISELELKWGQDVEMFSRNLLFNELKSNKKIVDKFIVSQRREKNLDNLI